MFNKRSSPVFASYGMNDVSMYTLNLKQFKPPIHAVDSSSTPWEFCIRAVFFALVTFLWMDCVQYAIVCMRGRIDGPGNRPRLVMAITGAQVMAEPIRNQSNHKISRKGGFTL